jgi:outer membrane protein assembly factor BamE
MNKTSCIFAAVLLTMTLSGCAGSWYPFVYKPAVYQGNIINPNAVAMLKIGITKDQVANLMGNPVLDTPLSPDTWHYVYTLREKGKLVEQKQLTLYFSNNKLTQIGR